MKVNKYIVWFVLAFWCNNSLLQGTYAYDDELASSTATPGKTLPSTSFLRRSEAAGSSQVEASGKTGGDLLGSFRGEGNNDNHERLLKGKNKKKKNKGGKNKKKKKKDDGPDDPDCPGDYVKFSFKSAWTITNDFYELSVSPTGDYPGEETIYTFGPFTEDRFDWESGEICLDPNLCYLFHSEDRHDGAPSGYPPSDVTFNGQTFFCTGEGDRGDEDTCRFGNGCP